MRAGSEECALKRGSNGGTSFRPPQLPCFTQAPSFIAHLVLSTTARTLSVSQSYLSIYCQCARAHIVGESCDAAVFCAQRYRSSGATLRCVLTGPRAPFGGQVRRCQLGHVYEGLALSARGSAPPADGPLGRHADGLDLRRDGREAFYLSLLSLVLSLCSIRGARLGTGPPWAAPRDRRE